MGEVGGVEAIAQWQRGVVAIGVRRDPLSESVLTGTGFIVDMDAGIISTCAHVVLDAFYDNNGPLDPGVEGASGGVAIGVGIGERIQWICRADLRCISQPPASYAQNWCSRCGQPQGPQVAPQQRRDKRQCLKPNCLHPANQQKQFLKGPPPSHWPVQDSADLDPSRPGSEVGDLDLALLQLADVSGQPLSEQKEPITGEPLLTLWPRCLMDGWSPDLGLGAAYPRGLPIPAGQDTQLVLQSRTASLADLACALRLGHASTLKDGEPFVMLGYGQSSTGTGADRTSTTTRGHFSGSYASSDTGVWYKTDVTILSGHSGGPVLNRRGEVIGWAVMSSPSLGQLRPVEKLLKALTRVLDAVAPGRAGATVRERLLGEIPETERLDLGDGATWEAAMRFLREASAAAAQAQAAAEQADQSAEEAQQAAGRAEQGAQQAALAATAAADAAANADGAAQGAAVAEQGAQQAAGRAEQGAQQAASAATAAADAAANAVRPLIKAADQAARQEEAQTAIAVQLRAAIQGMNLGDSALIAGLLMSTTAMVQQAFQRRAELQALPADVIKLLAAHPSASVLLVIEMPLVLAQAIMELARARDAGLVKLGFRCCQLGEEVVPLGGETRFTKYAQELRDIPVEAAVPAAQPHSSDPGGKGSFLVTSCSRLMRQGKELSLDASLREIQAFRRFANVHEDASLSEFREAIRFARAWWYTGYDTGYCGLDSTGLPLFFTEAAKAREISAKGKHVMSVEQDVQDVSMEEIRAIVASAVADGQLEVVVLNACRTLKLAEALSSSAGVPFVVCWEGYVADEAAMIFGTALASHVSAGEPHEDAFKRACEAVEAGGKWKLEEPQLKERRLQPAERPWAAGVPRRIRRAPHASLASLGAGALPASSKRKLDDDELSEGGMSSISALTQLTQDS